MTLRDEVYCQLMKQTTANRSQCTDSSQRAWRLLSVLAAYFGCSDALKPYLLEHLTAAASDRRRSCHGTAAVCLTNLRKTARCGGRKNVPSVEEVTAVSAGRYVEKFIFFFAPNFIPFLSIDRLDVKSIVYLAVLNVL